LYLLEILLLSSILKTTEKENSAKMSIKNEIKNLHRKNNKNS